MAKDILGKTSDLTWLSSTPGSSLARPMLGFPNIAKAAERANEFESWESFSEPKVCRNLSSSWGINSAAGLTPKPGNISLEKISHDKGISDLGLFGPVHLSNKSIYDSIESDLKNCVSCDRNFQQFEPMDSVLPGSGRTFSQDVSARNSSLGTSSNAASQDPNFLAHLISYFNEENRYERDQLDVPSANSLQSSLHPSNFISPSYQLRRTKNSDLSLMACCTETYTPPSSCRTSPKTNPDLVALMQELALMTGEEDCLKFPKQSLSTPFQSPPSTPGATPTKGCVFCKNNSYHSTFYKSHVLKDERGHCQCPVLRTYVCPLCGGTGDSAHTLKYCPRNTVTRGDPIAAGLPPGKVTNWREVATKMASHHKL